MRKSLVSIEHVSKAEPFSNCLAGVKGRGEKGAGKPAIKGKHPIQHADDAAADHDFLGCMSRSETFEREKNIYIFGDLIHMIK